MHPKSRWTSQRVVVEADLCRIFDHDSRELGTIDPLALSVLKLADGTQSPSAIAEAISTTRAGVEDAFDRLRSVGLLDGWAAPPTASSVVSRRRVVMDVGRAAAAFGAAVGTFAVFGPHDAFAAPKEKHYKKP
jgi:hypothetical protein